jgi:hypothetical protein
MNRNYLLKIFFIIFVFSFLFIGCDNDILNKENTDTTNNGNESSNNNGNETTNETPNNGNGNNSVNDKMHLIKGTIWYKDNSSLFIEFSNNNVLFRNYQNYGSMGGNLNGNVTHGNFRISSYDGETLKLLDYDNKEIAITIIIFENKMTVDKLNAIKWTAPPFEPRFFGQWNGTYSKEE